MEQQNQERESSLEERERKDAELAADRKARQVRLGHVPAPEEQEEEKKPKPKPKARSKKS